MDARDRGARPKANEAIPSVRGACAVCAVSDGRLLVSVELSGGESVVLCGSHELLHRRSGARSRTVAELRAALGERRASKRRATGEVDELAERLTAAFTRERRSAQRRAG
jgi:hypothetical protein